MSSLFRFIFICALTGWALLFVLPLKQPRADSHKTARYAALLGAVDSPLLDASQEHLPLPPHLTAEAAVVYDPLQNEFLFQKNAEQLFGIASITKIMTALAALERIGENDIIEIHAEAVAAEGDEAGLLTGEHFSLRNLIVLMLASSSNDAAVAIAEHVGFVYGAGSFEESQNIFVRFMNETAGNLGLTDTHFENPTGLDTDEKAGIISNVSTAEETARLIGYALRYPLMHNMHPIPATLPSEEGSEHVLSPTHTLLMNEPGVISGKTGFTDAAGGTLATVAEIPVGKLSIIVVLNSTRLDRFDDTARLLDWLRTH